MNSWPLLYLLAIFLSFRLSRLHHRSLLAALLAVVVFSVLLLRTAIRIPLHVKIECGKMSPSRIFTYEAVTGFFEHDMEPTGPEFRATLRPGLGLLERDYDTDAAFDPEKKKTQWARFVHFLEKKNEDSRGQVRHKLVFLSRHGQGFHNVKEAEVGRHEWDSYWSHQDGDEKMNWFDSFLTETGKQQARDVHEFWLKSIDDFQMPTPELYYTSPHARCLETSKITYSGLDLPADRPFKPIVKEKLRERFGVHSCDRRRSMSWIASNYPDYTIEQGFTEEDKLWKADARETEEEIANRVKEFLGDVFNESDKAMVAFVCHSGFIRALYGVTKHSDVWIAAGAMVPLLLRAEAN
ncbi:histidine phosphatase superfamily [Xylariaceae sp. FL0016]|nr:histidine phosphatase superfamily [Xylariaceae sp. FL0016]